MGAEHLTQALARCPQPPQVIFNVHLNGQCADPEAISAIARKSGAVVIEDACHALGTTYRSADGTTQEIGSCRHSLMAVFSFHAVKAMTMGEGGAITTNDPQVYDRLRRLRSHGMTRKAEDFQHETLAFDCDGQPNPWYYEMSEMGYNYRATDFQCALGLSQLKKLERLNGRRRELAVIYDRLFAGISNFVRPIDRPPSCNPIWHLYVVHIDFSAIGRSRAEIMKRLAAAGIGTQVHYLPVHRQPYYVSRNGALTLHGADRYYEACLSLPFFPGMSDDDPARVVGALQDAIHGRPA